MINRSDSKLFYLIAEHSGFVNVLSFFRSSKGNKFGIGLLFVKQTFAQVKSVLQSWMSCCWQEAAGNHVQISSAWETVSRADSRSKNRENGKHPGGARKMATLLDRKVKATWLYIENEGNETRRKAGSRQAGEKRSWTADDWMEGMDHQSDWTRRWCWNFGSGPMKVDGWCEDIFSLLHLSKLLFLVEFTKSESWAIKWTRFVSCLCFLKIWPDKSLTWRQGWMTTPWCLLTSQILPQPD